MALVTQFNSYFETANNRDIIFKKRGRGKHIWNVSVKIK